MLPARTGLPRAAGLTASPKLVATSALLVAMLAGALLTRSLGLGLALVAACCFVPLVFLVLPLAIAAWVPLATIEYSNVAGKAPLIATGLLVVAWLGSRRARGTDRSAGTEARPVVVALGLLLAWLTLSIAWAGDPTHAWRYAKAWYLAAAAFIVIVTVVRSPRDVRLLALAFVAGALLSIVVGLTGSGISTTANAVDLAARQRFAGGAGDPNYLAAGLVAAIALAAGLLPSARNAIAKLGLAAAIAAIAAALAATQSRGGLIGAIVALVVAVALARGQRVQAAAFGVFVIAAAGAFFLASPGALHRVTTYNAGGAGRHDLWTVAWRMSGDHPVDGVGLAGFPTEAKNYVRQPGSLSYVRIIVDEPEVVHNLYLEQLAETGIVGLALLLAVIATCIASAGRAARRFDARGDPSLASPRAPRSWR